MNQIEDIYINDLCRFCICKKTESSSFIKLKESHLQLFKVLTDNDVGISSF